MVRKIPLGVKIISILCYILAVALVILGIGFISNIITDIQGFQTLGAGFFIFAGIILILLSILIFLIICPRSAPIINWISAGRNCKQHI